MALTTYAELLTAVDNWVDRSDLTSRTPEFIALCEAGMNRKLRSRRWMLEQSEATITSEFSALPTDYLEAQELTMTDVLEAILRKAAENGLRGLCHLRRGWPVLRQGVHRWLELPVRDV
jgi:hypothetical protein